MSAAEPQANRCMTYIILCDYYSMVWRQYKQCNTDVTQTTQSRPKVPPVGRDFLPPKVKKSALSRENVLATAVIEKRADQSVRSQLVEKAIFDFYASCGSTHSIEFALQIHKFREHGPDHPLLPLCDNSPCVSRNLYKGRKNVSAGRGFSSRFARKRGFEREAVRKQSFSTASERTNRSALSVFA